MAFDIEQFFSNQEVAACVARTQVTIHTLVRSNAPFLYSTVMSMSARSNHLLLACTVPKGTEETFLHSRKGCFCIATVSIQLHFILPLSTRYIAQAFIIIYIPL